MENGLARENIATGGFQQPNRQKCDNQVREEGRAKDLFFSQIARVSVTTKLINNSRVVYTTIVCMHRGVNYGERRRQIVDGVNGTRIERSMRV